MKSVYLEKKAESKLSVKEDTRYILDLQDSGKVFIYLELAKPGVEAEIIGLYELKNDQKLNLTTVAHHKTPNTKCTTSIRGVLLGASRSDYVGKILIDKKAQQTTSYLEDKVLSLGKDVKSTSQPILEIEADDVKASHEATTGRIDEEQLFYLQSRGFSYDEAKNTIIKGFFTEVLLDLPKKERDAILKKLRL